MMSTRPRTRMIALAPAALALLLLASSCTMPEGAAPPPPPEIEAPSAEQVPESAPQAAEPATLALVGGRVLDGYGGPPLDDATVLVQEGLIVALGRSSEIEVPSNARVIETQGMTVMPGLIDMHVHLHILGHGDYERWDELYRDQMVDVIMPIAARQLLHAGVTSARDLGGPPDDILEIKRRIAAGEVEGPRMFVSGPFLQQESYTEWERDYRWGVTSVVQARQVVQDLAGRGVDVIKLIDQDQMQEDVVEAIVDTAHANNLPVVAHAHRMEEIRIGLRYGVDNFEHTGLGTAPGYAEDVLQALRERNSSVYWTPTISPLYTMQYTGEIFPERLDDPAWRRGMPGAIADEIRDSLSAIPHLPYYALFPSRIPRLPTKFAQLRETGVRMMIGTDSGIPTMFHNDSTWREMALWVELGVPPMEVVQSATLWPARFLRVEDQIGTLAPGRQADIIAVRGDPLTDMRVMRDVELVIKGGRTVR